MRDSKMKRLTLALCVGSAMLLVVSSVAQGVVAHSLIDSHGYEYELTGMYEQFRKSFGITESVRDKSCDNFDESETDKALILVGAAMLNDWDFWFLTPKDEVVIHSNTHDDIISLETKDPQLRRSLIERWEQVGCRRLSQRYLRELAPLLFADE
ncbi:MAG: hypothetical protein KIT74_11060 [Fimbriimonadales bacterium]|nr:hypothetical protein [Fimbriimonadales bacterium]